MLRKYNYNVVTVYSKKAYRDSRGIAPLILNFGTRCKPVVNFMPRPNLRLGKGSRYPLNRRVDGPKNWLGSSGVQKDILSLQEPTY
jgi:hypothetical protein